MLWEVDIYPAEGQPDPVARDVAAFGAVGVIAADATAGCFAVLFRGRNGEAYNVGNDHAEASVRELAEVLAALFPERSIQVLFECSTTAPGYLPTAVPRTCPDVSKIRALGWTPTTPIEEGFRRTVRSYD